jgi:hypothetical protein
MAVQSSYHTVAEQVINFNNNVVDLLSKINQLVSSTDPSVTINVTDQSGVARQFNLPSFGFLKSEIDRLNNNINSIYSINEGGALIQPSNGTKFRKIVTVDLNREPNDINNLSVLTTFKTQKNWFFDSLLNPQLFIELDLSGQVENNVRKILCRRYIPEFATDSTGTITPLGQSALNSFNSLFRGKNSFTIDEFETWHQNTPGLIEPFNPKYDEQMFDLEPNVLEYDGTFTVIKIEEDTLNKKLWYHVDTLNYVRNVINRGTTTQETKQLSINDEMIINTPISTTRYKITEISAISSNPRLRFERVEGSEPIPVGVGTLKIYSPVLYNKKALVSVSYNERNTVFVKPLDMDNYLLSKNWSKGVGYWTNDLSDIDSGISMEQFYIDTVYDYGTVLHDLVAKKTPNRLAGAPNKVTPNVDNFKVVQINKHLTDTPDSNLIKNKHNQQKTLKSEVKQILDAISEKNKQLKVTRFTSESERKQFNNELGLLQTNKDSKGKLLSSITTEIIDLSKSPVTKVDPIFHVRGFWSMPEAVVTRGTKPQEVVQFRVQYRYLSKDGKETPVETFKLNDATTGPNTGAFSNWQEIKTDARKRTFNATTGQYTWSIEDVSNADTPNINQLDIPIKYGEKVEIRIKSISEVGWPDSPVESDWSETLTVEFPDSLNNVLNENDFILKEASKEDLRVTVQNDLSAKGLDEHLSEQLTVNNVTYVHSTDKILSGFKDANGVSMGLFDYLSALETRIKSLEEKIKRVKGELEVVIYRNSDQFVAKNGTELTFNVECEDYLDTYTATGVSTGRVYQNNVYVIKDFLMRIRNKSVETALGLLSNRVYSATSNSDVYNSSSPQVFWVDQQNELVVDNSSGVSKTQRDNQFIWMVNYDNVNQTTVTKLAENVGNGFISANTNTLTSVLSTNEFNLGYGESSILSFIGNNTSLLDPSKWIDTTVSVASTTKLLTTIHPQVQGLDKIQETNVDKIKSIDGGDQNDIIIPINIYFKMNALDPSNSGLNYEYVNLNGAKTTVRHIKKLKFLLENEVDNRPFIFTIKFVINRSKVVMKKSLVSTPTQLISNR